MLIFVNLFYFLLVFSSLFSRNMFNINFYNIECKIFKCYFTKNNPLEYNSGLRFRKQCVHALLMQWQKHDVPLSLILYDVTKWKSEHLATSKYANHEARNKRRLNSIHEITQFQLLSIVYPISQTIGHFIDR